MEKTAYEILGVSETATDDEIKKQYHTLMRNLHPDATVLDEFSAEQEEENLKRVKVYNEAYDKLSRGRRSEYDRLLTKQRARANVIYGKKVQNTYMESSMEDLSKIEEWEKAKETAGKIFEEQFDELLKNIFRSGASFQGSFSGDAKQNLRQDYWRLKSEKEKLERDLRVAEQEARIEYMKKSPINDIQLEIDSRHIASQISALEAKRRQDLQSIAQDYFFKLNKRFMTEKKRQSLLQNQRQEEDKMNVEYNLLLEQYNQKKVKIDMDLAEYQKAEREAIKSNPKVQTIKCKLEIVQNELEAISVKLGYQPQTSSYTNRHGVEYH